MSPYQKFLVRSNVKSTLPGPAKAMLTGILRRVLPHQNPLDAGWMLHYQTGVTTSVYADPLLQTDCFSIARSHLDQLDQGMTHTTFTFRLSLFGLSVFLWYIVSKLMMYRLIDVVCPFGLYDPMRVSFQSQMNETSQYPCCQVCMMGSEQKCGIVHHMSPPCSTCISH